MPIVTRYQRAVYWAKSGNDAYGSPTVSNPIELAVRWEKGFTREIPRASVSTLNVTAVHASVWVDREIELGSMMREGTLLDMPSTPDEIMEVVDYVEIPDVKGRNPERIVLLSRFANSLPTIA